MTHIHYRRHNYIVEYTPLMLAYIVLCLYLYFSVREFFLYLSISHTHTCAHTRMHIQLLFFMMTIA